MMNAPMDQGPPRFAMVRVPGERSWTNFASTVPFPEHRIQLNRISIFAPGSRRLEARGWSPLDFLETGVLYIRLSNDPQTASCRRRPDPCGRHRRLPQVVPG